MSRLECLCLLYPHCCHGMIPYIYRIYGLGLYVEFGPRNAHHLTFP